MSAAKILDLFEGAEGAEGAGNAFTSAFERMEWAEDEIAKAKRARPILADKIDKVFGLACPEGFFLSTTEGLFRRHVRELCDRAGTSAKMNEPTAAEGCWLLSQQSLKAPMAAHHHYAYVWLFGELYGRGRVAHITGEHQPLTDGQLRQGRDFWLEELAPTIKRRITRKAAA
ncbi:MAG: hypothetical protein GY719_24900 [bacterium]|nr:hypothetical protein [bacterium]